MTWTVQYLAEYPERPEMTHKGVWTFETREQADLLYRTAEAMLAIENRLGGVAAVMMTGGEGGERMDRTATFSNDAGTITTGTGEGRGREADDTLQTSTRVQYSNDYRKVNVTLTPGKARDLIELLEAYIKYKEREQ